ncbi:MAG: phosphoglycerate kinase [Patescibacteria group bacterium]|jgi:phosphoglycerate kinase
MYHFKTIQDIDISYKKVLLRVALDIPLRHGKVAEDYRIRQILPTLAYLLKKNCSAVIVTWLGRPDGKVMEEYRLDPVAKRLSQLIRRPVKKVNDCVGPESQKAVFDLEPGEILMLENTRFHPEEMSADPDFTRRLADGFDIEVFDGFAQSHRVHASTTGLLDYLPTVSGFLLQKEMDALGGVLHQPSRPLTLIIGGAKVSDKIGLTANLISKADKVLIGGVCASVFIKARGQDVGQSYLADVFVNQAKKGGKKDYFAIAKFLLKKYPNKIMLPLDMIAASDKKGTKTKVVDLVTDDIPKGWSFFDIGPETVKMFAKQINRSKTVLWNGPMGMYENKKFETGTASLVKAVAGSDAVSIGGGGDTEELIGKYGLAGKFSHVSTGGGAMLEFLSGKKLPVLEAMVKNQHNIRLWRLGPKPVVAFTKENNPYFRYPFHNLKEILGPAQRNKFGVPACNIRSKYILDAVLQAAFEERSPVILEIAESEMGYCNIPPERMIDLVLERLPKLEKKFGYRVPVCLHADHMQKDLLLAERAMKAGFSSALIDQSAYPLDYNISVVRSFVQKAHPLGITIEGEIGQIGQGMSGKGQLVGKDVLTHAPSVHEAVEFISQTGVDAFAGFFGNYHGKYEKEATIVWPRIKQIDKQIKKRVWTVPIVLHGTSYLRTKDFDHIKVYHQAIKCGMHKFNYGTMLSDIFKDYLPQKLVDKMDNFAEGGEENWKKGLGHYEKEIDALDPAVLKKAVDGIKKHVKEMMKKAWYCSGKVKLYK